MKLSSFYLPVCVFQPEWNNVPAMWDADLTSELVEISLEESVAAEVHSGVGSLRGFAVSHLENVEIEGQLYEATSKWRTAEQGFEIKEVNRPSAVQANPPNCALSLLPL